SHSTRRLPTRRCSVTRRRVGSPYIYSAVPPKLTREGRGDGRDRGRPGVLRRQAYQSRESKFSRQSILGKPRRSAGLPPRPGQPPRAGRDGGRPTPPPAGGAGDGRAVGSLPGTLGPVRRHREVVRNVQLERQIEAVLRLGEHGAPPKVDGVLTDGEW